MDTEKNREHRTTYRDHPFFSDDLFQESDLPLADFDDVSPSMVTAMPRWLDETRLVCFLAGAFGLLATLFNLDFFFWQISNPFFLNLTLLLGLAGFANFMLYPNVLKYCQVNGIKNASLLRTMNGFMLGFSALLLVFLFSFPVTGLGLALVLIPAPVIFGYFSRKYLDQPYQGDGIHFSVLSVFNQDIRRLAWFSLTLIFLVLILAFTGIFLGII